MMTGIARGALAALFLVGFSVSPATAQTPAPEGASLYFIGLEDGDTVSSPLTVRFGLSGMGVAPAGTEKEHTGHHHLLIDRPAFGEHPDIPDEATLPVLADEHHLHFGGGQTETTIELDPGAHTLQLLLGDWSHIPHDPPVVSERITIMVE